METNAPTECLSNGILCCTVLTNDQCNVETQPKDFTEWADFLCCMLSGKLPTLRWALASSGAI